MALASSGKSSIQPLWHSLMAWDLLQEEVLEILQTRPETLKLHEVIEVGPFSHADQRHQVSERRSVMDDILWYG